MTMANDLEPSGLRQIKSVAITKDGKTLVLDQVDLVNIADFIVDAVSVEECLAKDAHGEPARLRCPVMALLETRDGAKSCRVRW
jgi:hypothetical protein